MWWIVLTIGIAIGVWLELGVILLGFLYSKRCNEKAKLNKLMV